MNLELKREIVERKVAEEALRRAKTVAETANSELEAFSYSVSHDLRAPLRAIDGFSLALVEDNADRLDAEGLRHLERIRAGVQRMGKLIDDLLQLAGVTRAEMRHEAVDLSALAREVSGELQAAEPDRDVVIVIEAGLLVDGDQRLLRIALVNLLSNARKFTRRKAAARIELGSTVQGATTAYFVRDNGVGFDMAYAVKLFGAFQRLHAATEFEGTGIGLATVRRIVARHGGRTWAEGIVGAGATFYFTLAPEGDLAI
jgi:light-regulated signal transduction histidine kinase (bacteriophytochrome)